MSGLILDTRDQLAVESVGGVVYHGTKATVNDQLPATSSRICGLPKPTFWLVIAFVLIVLGAAIGGGLGGGLSAAHKATSTSTR
jgi:hypothetical protein